MISLQLYGRLENYVWQQNLVGRFSTWRRTSVFDIGYHIGKMTINDLGELEATDLFNSMLGKVIKETTYGITSYEGLVWQLDLIKNGVNYRRSLAGEQWHNRVKAKFTDYSTQEAEETAWVTNDKSIEFYGEMEYIVPLGNATDAQAAAQRDRELNQYSYPISKTVGSVDVSQIRSGGNAAQLIVTTVGLGATLNWQIKETTTTSTASSVITTLINSTDYVVPGNIETNSLSVSITGAVNAVRVGDAIRSIVAQGDASGNIWRGGVYADMKYDYEQVPDEVRFEMLNGRLYEQQHPVAVLQFVKPGFYIYDQSAPATYTPPGVTGVQNTPKVSFCNEVEFIYPNALLLKFPGEVVSPLVVLQKPDWAEPGEPTTPPDYLDPGVPVPGPGGDNTSPETNIPGTSPGGGNTGSGGTGEPFIPPTAEGA